MRTRTMPVRADSKLRPHGAGEGREGGTQLASGRIDLYQHGRIFYRRRGR
jgi:hypothetical protein